MRIEEEIKQKSFKSEFHKLIVNLKFTSSWLSGFHTRILKVYGISSQQFNVLRILKGQYPKPSSLILIKERMLDKDSNASRLIDKLESAGLTKRMQCPKNRRKVDITITQSGLELLEKINPEMEQMTHEIINLNKEEASIMNSLLDKLREGAENNSNIVSLQTERSQ